MVATDPSPDANTPTWKFTQYGIPLLQLRQSVLLHASSDRVSYILWLCRAAETHAFATLLFHSFIKPRRLTQDLPGVSVTREM